MRSPYRLTGRGGLHDATSGTARPWRVPGMPAGRPVRRAGCRVSLPGCLVSSPEPRSPGRVPCQTSRKTRSRDLLLRLRRGASGACGFPLSPLASVTPRVVRLRPAFGRGVSAPARTHGAPPSGKEPRPRLGRTRGAPTSGEGARPRPGPPLGAPPPFVLAPDYALASWLLPGFRHRARPWLGTGPCGQGGSGRSWRCGVGPERAGRFRAKRVIRCRS